MKSSRAVGALLIGWAIATVGIAARADEAPGFDYLYIVANEGGSSGGHTAIRFGRDVYHFQFGDGLLVLQRDRADEFFYSYALLGNRTIHATRVAVSKETLSRLVDGFRRRHRAQEAQLLVQDALNRDRALLEFLADRDEHPSAPGSEFLLSVPGLGYFESGAASSGRRSSALESLRREIVREHGPEFLEVRRRGIAREMRALYQEDPTAWPIESPTSVDDHPLFAQSYSSRWIDLRAARAAMDVLEQARPLADPAHHAPDDDAFLLSIEDIAALERFARTLVGQLVDVSISRRSDWGQTLLVGMARLEALDRSIATGRLVFLDTFPEASAGASRVPLRGGAELIATLLSESRQQFEASRAHFRDRSDPDELSWERLEERSNRYLEILESERNEGEIRVAKGHLVPSRSGLYPVASIPSAAGAARSEHAVRAGERERVYAREMRRLHRYELITQNCATAIFETVNASLGGSVEDSETQLGGHIGEAFSLAFIPFVSSQQVNERYRVTRQETIPSYRQRRLQQMKERENPVWVALRESNTFTSESYQRHSDDSFFVFFTDEAALLRPVMGIINLIAAIGESVVGVVTAPVDRGEVLLRGLRGALVSLPELAFVNIRKGSNDWIPSEHRVLLPEVAGPELGSDAFAGLRCPAPGCEGERGAR